MSSSAIKRQLMADWCRKSHLVGCQVASQVKQKDMFYKVKEERSSKCNVQETQAAGNT